jgi:hypothetical protein
MKMVVEMDAHQGESIFEKFLLANSNIMQYLCLWVGSPEQALNNFSLLITFEETLPKISSSCIEGPQKIFPK